MFRRAPGSSWGALVGRFQRDLAETAEEAAGADELGAYRSALLEGAHRGVAEALEEAVALEHGRAGEVGLGDEAAGGLERSFVLAAAAGGGQGGRPHAERLAAGRGGEPAGSRALVQAARDGRGELARGAAQQLVERRQRLGRERGVADLGLRGGGGLGGQAPQLGGREAAVAAAGADDVDAARVGPA